MIQLTQAEKYVIQCMREAVPYEIIEVHKDKSGKTDTYLIRRSQKIIVSEIGITPVQ